MINRERKMWLRGAVFGGLVVLFALAYAGTIHGSATETPRGAAVKENILYVDRGNITGWEDGRTWETAFVRIQTAIDVAAGDGLGKEVWLIFVKAGDYDEDRPGPDGSLVMKSGVHLYGGFAGGETSLSERDWNVHNWRIHENRTTINGSKARAGAPAYHVVKGANRSTLDGFVIEGGNACGPEKRGASDGGGMRNYVCSPTVVNCAFYDNKAVQLGGGVFNTRGDPTFTNCQFVGNKANSGGAMFSQNKSSPRLVNCVFALNVAKSLGGGLHNEGGDPELAHCTFVDNSAYRGGGAFFHGKPPTIVNCIFWANGAKEDPEIWGIRIDWEAGPFVTHSCVQGGWRGEGNIKTDARFVEPTKGDFRLASDSGCINTGTSDAGSGPGKKIKLSFDLPEFDIRNEARPQGGRFDIGAYEYDE